MKKLFTIMAASAAFFLMSAVSYSQNIAEHDWLSLTDKITTASYEDAVKLFIFQLGKTPSEFNADSEVLAAEGIALDGYSGETLLTKGMLSLMTAKYLKLDTSLMYSLFGTERYAFRACIASGLFDENGSESGKISGPALIEIFSRISELKEGQK